ncbi:helix-turn-helix transcriptional regulator [Ensifer adhaerens]|uniref:helix-turn-helix transcriptional regulator n=1 Tax=Ensifer adhaerens TaxID=106592 RepID=UPI000DC3B6AE|nr:WYL domain-containing protein [Ensifer adhaerens]
MVASTVGPEGKETFQTLPLLAVSRQRATDDHTARWGSIVRRTIHERRIVELSHCDLEGRGSNRRLQPFGLTLFDDVWLLTAWCELRDDFRNFRLDRIGGIRENRYSLSSSEWTAIRGLSRNAIITYHHPMKPSRLIRTIPSVDGIEPNGQSSYLTDRATQHPSQAPPTSPHQPRHETTVGQVLFHSGAKPISWTAETSDTSDKVVITAIGNFGGQTMRLEHLGEVAVEIGYNRCRSFIIANETLLQGLGHWSETSRAPARTSRDKGLLRNAVAPD